MNLARPVRGRQEELSIHPQHFIEGFRSQMSATAGWVSRCALSGVIEDSIADEIKDRLSVLAFDIEEAITPDHLSRTGDQ
jgi:hypothetical protein